MDLDQDMAATAADTEQLRRNRLRDKRDELAEKLFIAQPHLSTAKAFDAAEAFIDEVLLRWRGEWPKSAKEPTS